MRTAAAWLLGLALLFGGLAVCRLLPPSAAAPAKAASLQPDPMPPPPPPPPYRFLGTG